MNRLKHIIFYLIFFSMLMVLSACVTAETSGKISQGSSIANIPLEGETSEEAVQIVTEKVTEWYGREVLTASSDYQILEIPRTAFQFDIEASVKQLEERTKRHWSNFFMKRKNVQLPLVVQLNEEELPAFPDNINVQKTVVNAISVAENLGDQTVTIEYAADPAEQQETIAEMVVPVSGMSQAITDHIIGEINGLVIPPNETFSFIESINSINPIEYEIDTETSFIASGIYGLALQTDLEILERHSQGFVPDYTEAGIEAEVDVAVDKDLLLYNPSNYAYTFSIEKKENEIVFELLGLSDENAKQYSVEVTEEIEPKTIYRYTPYLPYGTEKTLQAGSNGVRIQVKRHVGNETGEEEQISTDFYPPQPTIILQSTAEEPEEIEEDIAEMGIRELLDEYANRSDAENETPDEDEQLEESVNEEQSTEQENQEDGNNSNLTETESFVEDMFYLCMLEDFTQLEQDPEQAGEEFNFCDLLGFLFLLAMLAEEGEAIEGFEDLEGMEDFDFDELESYELEEPILESDLTKENVQATE